MTKTIISIAVIIALLSFLFFTKFNGAKTVTHLFPKNQNSPSPQVSPSTTPKTADFPGKVVLGTKDSLENQVRNTAKTLNSFLEKTASTLLGKENQTQVTISSDNKITDSLQQSVIQIDLLKDRKLKIEMTQDKESYFKFQNVPADFCLYLNQEKYPIAGGKIVSIKLPERGAYPISFDFCDAETKNIGEILVY